MHLRNYFKSRRLARLAYGLFLLLLAEPGPKAEPEYGLSERLLSGGPLDKPAATMIIASPAIRFVSACVRQQSAFFRATIRTVRHWSLNRSGSAF